MDTISGNVRSACVEYKDFPAHVDEIVCMKGMIHRIREMTGFAFVIIRTARDVVQCVYSPIFPITAWTIPSSRAAPSN